MYLKNKNKILRKYDCDFWNFTYNRRRKNKFFAYFKLSLIYKLQMYRKKKIFFFKKKKLKIKTLKNNIFSNVFFKNINFYKYFNKKRKNFVKYIFYKFTTFQNNSIQSLISTKTSFRKYVNKIRSPFLKFKTFIKMFTLFYNNFNQKKLKKLAEFNKKSRIGVLIFSY